MLATNLDALAALFHRAGRDQKARGRRLELLSSCREIARRKARTNAGVEGRRPLS
jgi:hypothetical protein